MFIPQPADSVVRMNLYEVIRWGNESDDPVTGGPDGPDTCFLVRAGTPDDAAKLADAVLARMPSVFVLAWSSAVYHLGVDGGSDIEPRVLRGPYLQHAYCFGWARWQRSEPGEPFVERDVS